MENQLEDQHESTYSPYHISLTYFGVPERATKVLGAVLLFAVAPCIMSLALTGTLSATGAWLLIEATFCIYLTPAQIAWYREHKNEKAILALNIFLGWTFIGWVVALVWALTKD